MAQPVGRYGRAGPAYCRTAQVPRTLCRWGVSVNAAGCRRDAGAAGTAGGAESPARARRAPGKPPSGRVSGRRESHARSEEHTSELQSLMRISYAVFCLKKKTPKLYHHESQERVTVIRQKSR